MSDKILCFDIDGTICSLASGDYNVAVPKRDRIATVNRLYDEGNRIILFTARGATTGIDWNAVTRKQLKSWDVKFHELHFGKPHYDIYVGDKAISDIVFFNTFREGAP